MTTNTTPSTASQAPAVSICYDEEFRALLCEVADESVMCETAWEAGLVAYIDAKRAEEREEAIGALAIAFEKMLCAAVGRDWSTSGISASSLVEELRSRAEKAEARATAAEAKLEAIRQGVEGLRWCYKSGEPRGEREAVWRDEALALFTTPPKADESGLPG